MRNFLSGLAFALILPALLAACATLSSVKAKPGEFLKLSLASGSLASGMDKKALSLAADAEYRALEKGNAGAPVNWKASDRLFGSVVPQQSFSVGATNCRRYVHSISQEGTLRSATATACRDEDGVWRPIE
jgi:surface antigen